LIVGYTLLSQRNDQMKANNVGSLKFDESQSRILIEIYEAVKDSKYKNIHDFYYDKIKDISHANLITDENGAFGGNSKKVKLRHSILHSDWVHINRMLIIGIEHQLIST